MKESTNSIYHKTESLHVLFVKTKPFSLFLQKDIPAWSENTSRTHCTAHCSLCKASTWIHTWTSLGKNSCAKHLVHKFLRDMMGLSNTAEKLLPISGAHGRQCSTPMGIYLQLPHPCGKQILLLIFQQKLLRHTEDIDLGHQLQGLAKINIYTTKNPPKFMNHPVFLTGCPEKWISLLWKRSRPRWLGLWASCSPERCPCPWQGAGTRWSIRSVPTQAILWFCDTTWLRQLLVLPQDHSGSGLQDHHSSS